MSCSYSCDDQPSEIQPYGDIAGSGVVAGFAGTAYMVMIILILYYVLVFDPKLDPFRVKGNRTSRVTHVNLVDDFVLSSIRKRGIFCWMSHYERLMGGRLEDTFNKCVLVLADTQIITGLAILISGFISIRCRLSSYHWQIIVYLAWLSSMTHLSTLTFLRNHLYNQPAEYFSRLLLMLTLIGLLCAAAIPTAFFDFYGDDPLDFQPSYFAICFYGPKMNTRTLAFQSMILFLVLSIYGYVIRIAKMSKWIMTRSHKAMAYISELFNKQIKLWNPIEAPRTWYRTSMELIARPLLIALLRVVTIQLSIFGSFLAEIYWLAISLSWGTLNLFTVRNYGPLSENTYTFGQVLPLIMLAAPLLSILENLFEQLFP
ncbi:hypothetical protein F4818DRAFT_325527 [Hypoxylon cercidicola]|nr:hypothetical protein F4818DRAFT_325527 [Hypoxylon cercidicola]